MLLFESVLKDSLTIESHLLCLGAAFICGIITAVSASVRSHPTKSFLVSLILLPMIVETVITMVNGNIGTGVAVMGAFSLVRFRSVPGKAKDIAAIFLAMTSGLACAAGYIGIAVLFTVIVCAVTVILSFVPLGEEKSFVLNITVPESLRFANGFDDIFNEYTQKHRLLKIKTSNMGSLYKLFYRIEPKKGTDLQEFIDKLRCRNGNLEIMIAEAAEAEGGESL